MKTNRKLFENESEGYFEDLPESTQSLVKELILEVAANRGGPDGFKQDEECIELLECRSRDGFIPFSSNRGGFTYRNFTDLMGYWGGGYSVSHTKADKEIQRQIEYNLECVSKSTYEKFEPLMKKLRISKKRCQYHILEEKSKKHPELIEAVQYIQDAEYEFLGCSESSIMHEFRFLYHGKEDGMHSASVSAAVNTEGPYHRSHVSWAPNVFCEGAKEIEIEWKTTAELKKKLKAALEKVSKEIF